jgi:hypothetical protein
MSTISRRVTDIEERQAVRKYAEMRREFEGRSQADLTFLDVHGFWPENTGEALPPRQTFTVRGIKTIVITEWDDEERKK